MNKRSVFIIFALLAILLVGNIVFISKYLTVSAKLRAMETAQTVAQVDGKVVDFMIAFITKVLQATTEVDFETRLTLETQVRDLNDADILTQWQKFTNSRTESVAQESTKDLLKLLTSKIRK